MSFSSEAKAEICKTPIHKKCCAVAEAYGVLLYCNAFTPREICIITDNRAFGARLGKLFRRAFGFGFDIEPEDMERRGKLTYEMHDLEKIEAIFTQYGYDLERSVAHHINLGVLEEPCCQVSFMRGAFLAGGSVTDPTKRYHLELVTDHFNVSRETSAVLLDMGFEAKSTDRNGNYILYLKNSGYIEDFLTTIGAPLASLEIMSAKVEKEMRNTIQRQVNCDTANVDKTLAAAQEQLESIRRIEKGIGLDNLPDKLQETALLRIANPEASIAELAQLANPPVTKSCLNHRLRKLMELGREK